MTNGRSSGESFPGYEESNGKAGPAETGEGGEIQDVEMTVGGAGRRGLGGGMGAPKRLEVRELDGLTKFC